jgi:hypothetical protein
MNYWKKISVALIAIAIISCSNHTNTNKQADLQTKDYKLVTSDIDNFWKAYDSLAHAQDSLKIIQELYLDKASEGLIELLKVRPMFTAGEYVKAIRSYPKFWQSVRKCTESIRNEAEEIDKAFNEIKRIYSDFNIPDVCFLITPVGMGGTSSEDESMLLIGAEIVAADATVDVSEFTNVLKDILGTLNVELYIIHEAIHTAQNPNGEPSMLTETLMEGSAEYISHHILKRAFRAKKYDYGYENECELWNEIKVDIEKDANYGKWFGNYANNAHPDMGYFIGYRIIESYVNLQPDKEKALLDIIKLSNPQNILSKSAYNGNCVKEN